jgi:hypothetical protein
MSFLIARIVRMYNNEAMYARHKVTGMLFVAKAELG